jgi:hypothetical protein
MHRLYKDLLGYLVRQRCFLFGLAAVLLLMFVPANWEIANSAKLAVFEPFLQTLLPAPSLSAPANGASGVSVNPTFSWSSVSGANRYWLIVATSPSTLPSDPNATTCAACIISGNTTSLSYTTPNTFPDGGHQSTLNAGTTYYWRVQGWNTNGTQGNYSSIFTFTTASAPDTTPPTFSAFDVSPRSTTTGGTFTISYTISDSGGSGLQRAELWRAPDSGGVPGTWANIRTNFHSGNGPVSSSFSDSLSTAGSYWYGMHIFDNAGNQRNEPAPIKVTVTAGFSSVIGSITSSTGGPIAGANVQIGNNSAQSDSQGNYSLSNMTAGDYMATVSKAGYATFIGPVSIPASTQARKNFILQPTASTTNIVISSIATKYPDRSFFLEGVSQTVTFTANVNWGGHQPGSVSFITPMHTYDILTNSSAASKTLDIGSEFSICQKLRVRARSTDGTVSAESEANFVVMSKPPLYSALRLIDSGDDFNYTDLSLNFEIDKLSKSIPGSSIPKSIPFFGNSEASVDFKVAPSFSITRDGKAAYALDLGLGRLDSTVTKGHIAGFEFDMSGRLGVAGNFSESTCRWNWGGTVGFHTDVFRDLGKWRIPQTAYIVYLQGGVGVRGDAQMNVYDIAPWSIDGEAWVEPYTRFTAGGGLDMILAVEGQGEIGGKFNLHPQLNLTFEGSGSYRIISKIGHFEYEHKVINCSYSFGNGGGCNYLGLLAKTDAESNRLVFYPRDYLKLPDYARFSPAALNAQHIENIEKFSSTSTVAIQSSVFPFSEPSASSSGNNFYLSWLYDDPARSIINRSEAVFSSWDGFAWSEPKPIADDGTGDFHPRILTFPDGSALATWEDTNSVLSDTATVDQLMSSVEISTSFFNPTSKQWVNTQRLTTNNYLDRSPLIAGQSSNDALIVWISNEQNDLSGSASKLNKLWSAKWNGTVWSAPQVVATIPYGIIKYDLSYSGGKGDVVLSLDTDNDPSTDEDHELYSLHYEGGVWGSLTRLTNDTVTDDNPRLGMDSKGSEVLAWIKGDEIYSARNGNIAARKLVAAPGHSTNVADFKLANTPDGRIALVWAGINAQFDSDIQALFYDPALDVWGNKSQLTSDEEIERNITAAFFGDKLIAVYDRTSPSTQTSNQTLIGAAQQTSIPTPGTTDLYMLTHIVGGDLAIKPNTLEVSPANPRPGEVTTLAATIVNQGDTAARDVPVSFYQGNPTAGGTLIGTTVIPTTLASAYEQQVSVPWTTGPTTAPFSIYVVVDPNQSYSDRDRSNNVASKQIVKPDLAIQSVRWDRQSGTSVLVTVRVTNIGSLPSTLTNISFRRDSATGTVLDSPSLVPLNPDQSVDVAIQWDTTGLNAPEYSLYIAADSSNIVDEYNETNNTATLLVSLNPSATPVIQLYMEQPGAQSNSAVALDSVLFTRDPFSVLNPSNLLNRSSDRNTRLVIFASNLHLSAGEPSSAVIVNLIDGSNQSFDVSAEYVEQVPGLDFTQVVFRLPDKLAAGTCTLQLRAHGQFSNVGTIRIKN